ncbi:MAG: leucine-rich repeat protein [Methanomassiliicoccaceae archaeon]|nr:leucine-rich repeat protein [Methanomassiliicoccaceae archaeon]
MKKTNVLLLALSLVAVASAALALQTDGGSAGAEVYIYDGEFTFVYDDSGSLDLDGNPATKEVTLFSYNWNSNSVIVPNTVDYNSETFLVTVIGKNAFLEKSQMATLTMGDNVRLVEETAFWGCTGIKKLDLKGVVEVREKAFMHCSSLVELKADSLVRVGDYAFALSDRYDNQPYPGPGDVIPYMDTLYLPSAEEIGAAAFGARYLNSVGREFGTVNLPLARTIGDYAFSESTIEVSLSIPRAQTIGQYAFFFDAAAGTDPAGGLDGSEGYGVSLMDVTSIGGYAFSGRAVTSVALSPTAPYTIGACAFFSSNLLYANLGMVTSIGTAAFDGIRDIQFFTVSAANPEYASLISSDPSAKGARGALYKLDALGDPEELIRLPPGIRPLLADYGNRFTVADGVASMAETAFLGCPSIAVDLNDVTEIPATAFSGSFVTCVTARNVTDIGFGAFSSCSALSSFDFLDTGGSLDIGQNAFRGTRLGSIYLPKDTTIGYGAFSRMVAVVDVVGVWGDTTVMYNSFADTSMNALQVSSDAPTAAGAKQIYDNWNASGWTYGGSAKTGLLIINNTGDVDITGLVPDGQGAIQLVNGIPVTHGSLQFVEFKDKKSPQFHMASLKPGIYWPEAHGTVGSPNDIKTDVTGATSSGATSYAGDHVTWELHFEYYLIVFYSFDIGGDANSNGIPDGEDPDYDETVNPYIFDDVAGNRVYVGEERYLAGTDLKSLLSPSFVRYSLKGWFAADDPDDALAVSIYTDSGHRVSVTDSFGGTIPEGWIIRDADDFGTLNLYALFIGKEYRIETEARLTGGQTTTGINDNEPNGAGGRVELVLATPINGSTGFDTGTEGYNGESYPYGTDITIYAIPNPGYAFVGWAVVDIEDEGDPKVIFAVKDDRSYVQSHGTAAWSFELPFHMKYVAYFAKTTTVEFDSNDGSVPVSREHVAGDRLVEDNNDYNGHDYEALVKKEPEAVNTGKGAPYYPGTPSQAGLAFDGWYSGATQYAGFDGTSLTGLVAIPDSPSSLALKARWYATITFHPSDGTNAATLSGAGVTEVSPGVYEYRHDVGTYASGGYGAAFDYGAPYTPSFVPVASDVAFNGWYVLGIGPVGVGSVEAVAAGTNYPSPYPDVYPTLKRLEPGQAVDGDMALIALYAAEVEFYFNGADAVSPSVAAPVPFKVTVPASTPTLFGSSYFGALQTAMANADTTGPTYKYDANGAKMAFVGWYESADGAAPPAEHDTMYTPATVVGKSVRLIAGWGVTVSFSDAGIVGIDDLATSAAWIPSGYGFVVLEGAVFDSADPRMPQVERYGYPPTIWYDAVSSPYKWFMNGVTAFTYSVTLVPEFNDLFEFNMMGGSISAMYVPYLPTDTFQDVLGVLLLQLETSPSVYIELTKAGLYYKDDGTARGIGDAPNAVWYRDDGDPSTSPSTTPAITYFGNEGTLVEWALADTVGSDSHAYIRWMAEVSFDRDVPSPDAGTSPNPPPIRDIDEGTPFSALPSPMPALDYNAAKEKSFKGWFNGAVRYTDQDGNTLAAPDVTGSMTLTAAWGVEVKFYYTGAILSAPAGSVAGSDAGGDFVIVDVAPDGRAPAPSLGKLGFTNNHLLWYTNGFGAAVPVQASDFMSSASPDWFDPTQVVTANTTVFSRWYADVTFNITPAGTGFFSSQTKYLLEGSKLADLMEDLDPFTGDPTRAGWIFIGWFDQDGVSGYEDIGAPYYRTGFDYTDGSAIVNPDAASLAVTKNVCLDYEHVVEVGFDCGFLPATPIPSKYLRANLPLPDSGPRFTPMPARVGVTFMGWFDLQAGKLYTLPRVDAPDPAEPVVRPMTLTAAWLVTVSFYDLEQYATDGMQLVVDGARITQDPGPDGILGTNDDYFEMPEGTTIRQFITVDPAAPGKMFVSWFVEGGVPDGLFAAGDVAYGLADRIASDLTLTAGYGFTVGFDTNGGTPSSIPDMLVIEGQGIALPEKPAKGRLTFKGWDDGSTVWNAGGAVTPVSDILFTAKWLVSVKIYDGVSMTPLLDMQWDEDVGPSFIYSLTTDPEYGGGVTGVDIAYTDGNGLTHNVRVEKLIDRYDPSANAWVPYYSVFDGWLDPFTGTRMAPTDSLMGMFSTFDDSAALFATWKERARFYDTDGTLLKADYVETGEHLGATAPQAPGWSDLFTPTSPLNPATYRIRDSQDFVAVKFITVTFDAAGGTPQQQVFNDVVSGTMLGAIGAREPARGSMYFAGWHDGGNRLSFTDRLYDDVTLTAGWQSAPVTWHTVFATAYENASISPQGMVRAMQGDTLRFSYYASAGYTPTLLVDGQAASGQGGVYTFSNIRGDHSIEAFASNAPPRTPTAFLTVGVSGNGGVMYSADGGSTFTSYTSPLPLFNGAEYVLSAAPKGYSYFDHWSGDASGTNPQTVVMSDGAADMSVTAHFGSTSGFGIGDLAIANLIFAILAIVIGIVALTVAYNRNYDGTGTGKALRFGAVFVALISLVLFFLTQGFGGTYVPYDEWSIVMAALTVITLALALVSIRYDYLKD